MGDEGQSAGAVCAAHGLRYDPAKHAGCVICRRNAGAPEPASEPAEERAAGATRTKVAVAGAATLVVVALAGVAVAVSALGKPGPAAASPGSGSIEEQLTRYVALVEAFDRSLPIEQARATLQGMEADAQRARIDVDARREKIKAIGATIDAQKAAFAAIAAPEPAASLRDIVLDQYDHLDEFDDVALDLLHCQEEKLRLFERRREVTTGDEAAALRRDFDFAQRAVQSALERNQRILDESRALAEKRRAEIARLTREHGLAPKKPAGPPPAAALDDDALAGDPFCQAILQNGGTIETCRAARMPDSHDLPESDRR